jgi:dTDP-4-dehydrorhamnose reductase|tara:strand:- start:701 stop:1552 length:852 start_codon:yes stop_codon:yes gene_type:complete
MLVIGKNGFLAQALIEDLQKMGRDFACTTRAHHAEKNGIFQLDLGNKDQVPAEIIRRYPDIVMLAAESSPDVCSNHYDLAYRVNVKGTAEFIERCLALGSRVLFFSSDTVYGDTGNQCVDEKSHISPFGPYAEMKAELESLFTTESLFKTARMSYVISRGDKYTSYLQSCLDDSLEVDVYDPLIRSPIWINDVLRFIHSIFEHWEISEKVNLCGPDDLGRLQILTAFSRAQGIQLPYNVTEPGKEFYEARPRSIQMRSRFLDNILGRPACSIEEAYKQEFGRS